MQQPLKSGAGAISRQRHRFPLTRVTSRSVVVLVSAYYSCLAGSISALSIYVECRCPYAFQSGIAAYLNPNNALALFARRVDSKFSKPKATQQGVLLDYGKFG